MTAPLEAPPEAPPKPPKTQGHPFEDVAVVTLVSLPFTALWSVVGALLIGGASQNRFPPEIDDAMLGGIAAATVVSSFGIGLFSAQWGPGKAAPIAPLPQTTQDPR